MRPTSRARDPPGHHAAFGVGYVIDVLQWVPYILAHSGAYRLAGGTLRDPLIVPGLSLGGGLDYQVSPSIAIGVGVREH